jgi:UrcA family protein
MPITPCRLVLAAVGLLALAPAAQAQPSTTLPEIIITAAAPVPPGVEVRHETVKFGDLDIHRRAGAERLLGRIRAAAGRVCAPEPSTKRAFADAADHKKCVEGAISHGVAELNAPEVTQAYRRGRR